MSPNEKSDSKSRRSFLKKGALATAVGVTASGTATAQEGASEEDESDPEAPEQNEQFSVIMFDDDFHSQARFILTSPVIEWKPTIPVDLSERLIEYDTYMGAYLNTGERFPIFVSEQAFLESEYSEEQGYFVSQDTWFEGGEYPTPQVYELTNPFTFYEQADKTVTGVARPLEDDVLEAVFDDPQLDTREEFEEFLF